MTQIKSKYLKKQDQKLSNHVTTEHHNQIHAGRQLAQEALRGTETWGMVKPSNKVFDPTQEKFTRQPYLTFDLDKKDGHVEFNNGSISSEDFCGRISIKSSYERKTILGYRTFSDVSFGFNDEGIFIDFSMVKNLVTSLFSNYLCEKTLERVDPSCFSIEKDRSNGIETKWYLCPNISSLGEVVNTLRSSNSNLVLELNKEINKFNSHSFFTNPINSKILLKEVTFETLSMYLEHNDTIQYLRNTYQSLEDQILVLNAQKRKTNVAVSRNSY